MDPEVSTPSVARQKLSLLTVIVIVSLMIIIGVLLLLQSRRDPGFVSGFVDNPTDILDSTSDRTNIIFLGIRGEGEDSDDLTDSMMLISLDHSNSEISLLSIPRDIWVDTMVAKVNTAYHYGRERRDGGGLDLARSAISEITGQPIHYAISLDFSGFVRAIDAIGGIDIEVVSSFDDYLYPIPGQENAIPESDRYEHLHFDAGQTHMDGATALQFARSRHAEGEEGTDFARSARQRQIILAFQDKIISTKTLLNLEVLKSTVNDFRSSIDTNIQDDEFGGFFRFFLNHSQQDSQISSFSLDELLITPSNRTKYQGQWVLVPIDTWQEIHDYVENSL